METTKEAAPRREIPLLGTGFQTFRGKTYYFDQGDQDCYEVAWDPVKKAYFTIPGTPSFTEIFASKQDAGPNLADVIKVICAYLGRRIRKLMTSLSA